MERVVLHTADMVRLNVWLYGPSTRRPEEFVEAFRFLMMTMRFEAGCLDCSAWIDADDSIGYTELWATEADIRRRVRSDSFTSLLSVIELATDATVQFDFVSVTRGLDYVAEVRGNIATLDPASPVTESSISGTAGRVSPH